MRRVIETLLSNRRTAGLAAVAFAGVMGILAARVGVDNSLEAWFVEGDPALTAYRDFLDRFGSDEIVVTAIHGESDALRADRLERLWHLTRAFQAVEGIARVRSLASVESVRGSPIGSIVVPVVDPPVGDDDVERARELLRRRSLATDLVGRDGRTLVIHAWLEAGPSADAARGRVIAELRAAAESARAPGEIVSQVGVGVMHEALNEVTLADGSRFVGLSYLVIAVAVWIVTRRLVWTAVAVLTVTAADAALFGVMALTGRTVNMVTIALPPLVMILGVANVVHLALEVDRTTEGPEAKPGGLARRLAVVARPCLFNTATTAVALLSLGVASMAVTRDYGVLAAAGVVFAFGFSLVGTTVAVGAVGPRRRPGDRVGAIVERAMRLAVRHRAAVTVAALAVGLVAAAGAGRIVVDTDSAAFLPPDHRARLDADRVQESVGPSFPLELTVETGAGKWRSATLLGRLAAAQDALEATAPIGRTTTAADVLRDVHDAVTGGVLDWESADDEDVENLVALLDRTGRADVLAPWVAGDDRALRLTATVPLTSARRFRELADEARRIVQETLGDDARVGLGGYLPLYSRIVGRTLEDQVTSFALAFALVFGIVAGVLRSARLAAAAIPPNLLPVVLVLGVMGFAGIRLDLATVTVAALVLGVIVDDSVHVLWRLRGELAKGRSLEEALGPVARASGVAIVSTSFVFAAGFTVIARAASPAIAHPGLLTAVAVAAALVTDLLVLPATASFLLEPRRTAAAGRRSGRRTAEPAPGEPRCAP